MKIAFIIFEKMVSLDFIGFFDPVTRLKTMGFMDNLSWDICALSESITDINGLKYFVNCVSGSLESYDVIFVPGGQGVRDLVNDECFLNWIKTSNDDALKTSACTGALVLGAAGFLKEETATTHYEAYDILKKYCKKVSTNRIVESGNVITAGGVTSSIDLGLFFCEKLTNKEVKEKIKKKIEYRGLNYVCNNF